MCTKGAALFPSDRHRLHPLRYRLERSGGSIHTISSRVHCCHDSGKAGCNGCRVKDFVPLKIKKQTNNVIIGFTKNEFEHDASAVVGQQRCVWTMDGRKS